MQTVFARRRRHLMDAFGPGSVIVVPGAGHQSRNSDVEHEFRQDSDFFYLTGFDEPDAVAVLCPGRLGEEYVLFVRPRDKTAETWTGRRAGIEGALALYGADKAFEISHLDDELGRLCAGQKQVCWTPGRDPHLDQRVIKAARRHRLQPRLHLDGPDFFADPHAVLSEMRLFKTDEEIATLRRAGNITAEAHHEAMRLCAPGMAEYELHAAVEYVFRASGAQRVGYGSIVARGDNATILHYTSNRMPVRHGDLVLIDAGAELDYLTADITRTFPASGRFSPEQRAVYEVVLSAQAEAIACCRPGRKFQEVHDAALRTLVQGMVDLGLLRGEVDSLLQSEAYKRYFMHRTSHWLGMDVHDVGKYHDQPAVPGSRVLQPGMVLTVEPGLYIGADDTEAPEAMRGIGVRIEDDILITAGEPDNLTAACVKQPDDVEHMVREDPRWCKRVVGF